MKNIYVMVTVKTYPERAASAGLEEFQRMVSDLFLDLYILYVLPFNRVFIFSLVHGEGWGEGNDGEE